MEAACYLKKKRVIPPPLFCSTFWAIYKFRLEVISESTLCMKFFFIADRICLSRFLQILSINFVPVPLLSGNFLQFFFSKRNFLNNPERTDMHVCLYHQSMKVFFYSVLFLLTKGQLTYFRLSFHLWSKWSTSYLDERGLKKKVGRKPPENLPDDGLRTF